MEKLEKNIYIMSHFSGAMVNNLKLVLDLIGYSKM